MLVQLLLASVIPLVCQAALAGGKADVQLSENDANVQFALGQINGFYAQKGDNEARTLTKVIKAESQVVAGVLTTLMLEVTSGAGDELCKVTVWSRTWLSADQAMQVSEGPSCKPKMQVGSMPLAGGNFAIDTKAKEVQTALYFAADAINAQENFMFLRKPQKTGSVTSQVIAGVAYHFKGVEMAATDCIKGRRNVPVNKCSVSTTNKDVRVCDFDVYWQDWMTPKYRLAHLSCK